jgi:hypothetical protein
VCEAFNGFRVESDLHYFQQANLEVEKMLYRLIKTSLTICTCMIVVACATTSPEKPKPEPVAKPIETPGQPETPVGGDMASIMSSLGSSSCSGRTLAATLNGIASSVEKQQLLYAVKDLSDCSGIFHRVMQQFDAQCPGPQYPSMADRDTRAIAKWYADKRQIVWINKPLQQDNLIRVGAVMFFGQGGVQYAPSQLGTQVMYTNGKGINHVGIVTKVKMVDGHVDQYWMLHGHGQRGKTAAGVTSTTYEDHSGVKKYNNQNRNYVSRSNGPMTPYGNWDEQWVGVAPVLQPGQLASLSDVGDGIQVLSHSRQRASIACGF